MEDIFTYKSYIEDRLAYHLSQNKTQDSYDSLKKLVMYATRGKMIRGCLILLSCEMFGGTVKESVYDIACAIELLHSGLLIHDDIIDRDDVRRGKASMHRFYEKDIALLRKSEQYHYGISQALCTGDLGFFWGMHILATSESDPALKTKVISLWSHGLIAVVIAEMQEQRLSLTKSTIKKEDILSLYIGKTGRYTFSLPLITGAMVAGVDKSVDQELFKLGEALGILFQIKDDELSLFGDPRQTGKPMGGDIREGKKTLYYYYTSQYIPDRDKERMKDIEFMQNAVREYGIEKLVRDEMHRWGKKARKIIERLPATPGHKANLKALVDYSLVRVA